MTDQERGLVTYDSQLLTAAQSVGLDLTPLLAQVPEADDDAYVGIIRQLLSAETAQDLDKPFNMEGLQDFEGKPIRVVSIRRMPSDYDSGLGLYLVCDIIDATTGEHAIVSTGSVNCIVQLVKAHTMGVLPLLVVPRFAKKPTANGYTPMHLEVVR